MAELWDIYDINKKKTGKTAERNVYQFKKGEYHIIVTGIIMNSKNEILISKRAEHKNLDYCGNAVVAQFWQEKQVWKELLEN